MTIINTDKATPEAVQLIDDTCSEIIDLINSRSKLTTHPQNFIGNLFSNLTAMVIIGFTKKERIQDYWNDLKEDVDEALERNKDLSST